MDPETQRLAQTPRNLSEDAFFAVDRSTTAVSRTVSLVALDAKTGRDVPGGAVSSVTFSGFRNRHIVDVFVDVNPVPHQRKTPKQGPKDGKIDPTVAGWTHEATYTCFFSAAAIALSSARANQPRLKVKILFGTGTEGTRHGVCGAVERSSDPTMLVVVQGVEPQYDIEFTNPANPAEKKKLKANNRWGVGITVPMIERAISRKFGRLISNDITVLAAFSTGYLGLQESIGRSLIPLDRLERVVIFDCLYATLKPALDRVKATKGSADVICYVVTEGGNSFEKSTPASFATLVLGRNSAWNYINLMGNVAFNAVASARLVSEATSVGGRIIDKLPTDYETVHNALVAILPARMTVVTDAAVFRKVKRALPSGATVLASFASDKVRTVAITDFFKRVAVTRHCIGRAQLLGWPAPPGEEWHDMLLVEFAWEYLS
jgi:hypothetical protein